MNMANEQLIMASKRPHMISYWPAALMLSFSANHAPEGPANVVRVARHATRCRIRHYGVLWPPCTSAPRCFPPFPRCCRREQAPIPADTADTSDTSASSTGRLNGRPDLLEACCDTIYGVRVATVTFRYRRRGRRSGRSRARRRVSVLGWSVTVPRIAPGKSTPCKPIGPNGHQGVDFE